VAAGTFPSDRWAHRTIRESRRLGQLPTRTLAVSEGSPLDRTCQGGALELPRCGEVQVRGSKIQEYLLSLAHPVGRAKAEYLISRGYIPEAPEILGNDLKRVARSGQVRSVEATEWGTKYLVVGSILAPDGKPLDLATVWMVKGRDVPAFVTAYPWREVNDEAT